MSGIGFFLRCTSFFCVVLFFFPSDHSCCCLTAVPHMGLVRETRSGIAKGQARKLDQIPGERLHWALVYWAQYMHIFREIPRLLFYSVVDSCRSIWNVHAHWAKGCTHSIEMEKKKRKEKKHCTSNRWAMDENLNHSCPECQVFFQPIANVFVFALFYVVFFGVFFSKTKARIWSRVEMGDGQITDYLDMQAPTTCVHIAGYLPRPLNVCTCLVR